LCSADGGNVALETIDATMTALCHCTVCIAVIDAE
jgi:hypothetical protein